jgi:hypothetical protein
MPSFAWIIDGHVNGTTGRQGTGAASAEICANGNLPPMWSFFVFKFQFNPVIAETRSGKLGTGGRRWSPG